MDTSHSAAQRVYEYVKARILDATYPGGELLTEGQLSSATAVSRTPVREALLRLEAEGMLRLYPKKGALVVPMSVQEAADVVEARSLVEGWSAPRAWTDRERLADELKPLLEEMRAHRASGDVASFSAADRAFHECIVAAAGNKVLTKLYRGLRERQVLINAAVMRVSTDRMDTAVEDHARFVEILREGERQDFIDLTNAHLQRALANSGQVV
jgi:DNA-binding GntR family transcriptional regulator